MIHFQGVALRSAYFTLALLAGIFGIALALSADAATMARTKQTGAPIIRGTKTRLVDIPYAENILFSTDGRLFVSGGTNVFEIVRDDSAGGSGYRGVPLYDGTGNFTGVAQIGSVLYAATFDGGLYAARLDQVPLALTPIHALGITSANGMAAGPDGELYIINGPLPVGGPRPAPKIVRVRFAQDDPLTVTEQVDWLKSGLLIPNGLRSRGRMLYVTDASLRPFSVGAITTVRIRADGSPGTPRLFASVSLSPLDDIGLDGESFLTAIIYGRALAKIDRKGKVIARTADGSFDLPSSVAIGQPPLFDQSVWLVTEKGPLNGSPTSTYGNALSLFKPDMAWR